MVSTLEVEPPANRAMTNFGGNLKLPMPEHFSGEVELWEDWSWNFKNYVSVHNPQAATLLSKIEFMDTEVTDALLDDADPVITAKRIDFSRKLHYLIALIMKGAPRLIVQHRMVMRHGVTCTRTLPCQVTLDT